MKKLVFLLLPVGLFIGCAKETPIDPVTPTPPVDTITHVIPLGKGSLKRNGTPWNAAYMAYYQLNDANYFNISAKTKENGIDHVFRLVNLKTAPGTYPIESWENTTGGSKMTGASYYVSQDIDQVFNFYTVDSTRANQYVEILRFDPVEHIVEGHFQTFLAGPTTWWFLPDSMAMTEGKFHLKVQ
jgi:hypothetical protein